MVSKIKTLYSSQEYNNERSSLTSPLIKIFWTAVAPFDPFIGFFVTQPLADMLALKTFTHGTSFTNYLNIRCFGADPSKGGCSSGSTAAFMGDDDEHSQKELENCKGQFYLFKDISDFSDKMTYTLDNRQIQFKHGKLEKENGKSEFQGKNGILIDQGIAQEVPSYKVIIAKTGTEFITLSSEETVIGSRPSSSDKYYLRTILPMRHAIFSGIGSMAISEEKGVVATCKRIMGAVGGALTPTLSIRVAEGDPLLSQVMTDPDFPDFALRTDKPIATHYMGLSGIIFQGLKGNLLERMANSPTKVFLGAVRLAALAKLFY